MASNISVVDVSSLKPHPNNKKIYDTSSLKFQEGIEALKKSIKEVGLLEPLVISKDNILMSGHRRLRCLVELGIEKCEARVVSYSNELIGLLEHNKTRVKTDSEKLNEIRLLEKELVKFRKMGRPLKGTTAVGTTIRKQVSEQLGLTESKVQQLKRKDVELEEIKKHDKSLFNKIKDKPYTQIKKAHNDVMADINMVKEFKGAFTRKQKAGLKKEFNILMDRYKPSIEELYVVMKERWTFTLDDKLKSLLD